MHPTRCRLWWSKPVSLFPAASARRRFAIRRGLGRCSNCFLGYVVSVAPRPFRFWVTETLVLVATISLSGKLWVSGHFPLVFRGAMLVVSETTDPTIVCVLRSQGAPRGFSLHLMFMVFASGHFCGITIQVIPGLSTLRVARLLPY